MGNRRVQNHSFFKKISCIYLFIFGCIPSSLLHTGFLQLQRAGATLAVRRLLIAVASHCGAQALGARASVVVARVLQSAGSVVVAHGLSCSAAYGIFPDQGSNPCPQHWQADSQPLRHQRGPSFLQYICSLILQTHLKKLQYDAIYFSLI